MYHHHLNLSHENNPLMGHGRFSDANVGDSGKRYDNETYITRCVHRGGLGGEP